MRALLNAHQHSDRVSLPGSCFCRTMHPDMDAQAPSLDLAPYTRAALYLFATGTLSWLCLVCCLQCRRQKRKQFVASPATTCIFCTAKLPQVHEPCGARVCCSFLVQHTLQAECV